MTKITLNPLSNLIDQTTAVNNINNNNATIQAAFDNTLSRDGTSPNQMENSLDMNNNQILNLPAPATPNSPARLQDVQEIQGGAVSSVGLDMPDDFTVTGSPVTTTGTLTADWAVAPTGNGAVVRATSPTVTTPTLTNPQTDQIRLNGSVSGTTILRGPGTGSSQTVTVPNVTDTLVGLTATQTLTNKTLTSPSVNSLILTGSTSGLMALQSQATATGGTMFLPNGTDTVVGKATADTFTNKTFDTAGTGNVLNINGVAVTANTGTGSIVRATTPTLVTPVLGAATATTINGSVISPGHHSGEPSTGNALAGEIGEVIQSTVLSGAAISLTTGTPVNLTSISLTAGDWDVSLTYIAEPAATTNITGHLSSISQTSGTRDLTTPGAAADTRYGGFVPGSRMSQVVGPLRIQLASTTTIYAVVQANFTVSTCTAYGILRARRAR